MMALLNGEDRLAKMPEIDKPKIILYFPFLIPYRSNVLVQYGFPRGAWEPG